MRYLMIAVLVVMVFCVTGCLTAQQQNDINRTTLKLAEKIKDMEELEDQLKDIVTKVKAGMIPATEGKALYENIKEDYNETKDAAEDFQATIDQLRGQGASGIDIVTGIVLSLISIAGSLTGVRVWRGSVNDRMGNIGAR